MQTNNNFHIKLIVPCRLEIKTGTYTPPLYCLPLGMAILTAFLRKHNYQVEQEDFSIKYNRNKNYIYHFLNTGEYTNVAPYRIEEVYTVLETGNFKCRLGLFVDRLLDSGSLKDINLIGFSNFTYEGLLFSSLLAKRIKQKTNIPIVFGGSFITLFGHLYTKLLNYVDYLIVGDGRVPLLRLINHFQGETALSEIPNLIYKDNKEIITNPREYYPLEDIPIPDFDDLPMDLYKDPHFGNNIRLPYQLSRGCPSKCSFCVNRYESDRFEFKSYGKIMRELFEMRQKYNSNLFHFCDNTINSSYEYLDKLCDIFIKDKLNIYWTVYAKVDNLDKKILRKMKESGCLGLFFGIESGSDSILKSMGKGFTSEQASHTLKDATEAGIINHICLISGHPYETQEDVEQTAKFVRKNKKNITFIRFYIFRLYYNSLIYFDTEKYGITNLKPIPYYGHFFAFDESDGLKWEEKWKQQYESLRQLLKELRFPLSVGISFSFNNLRQILKTFAILGNFPLSLFILFSFITNEISRVLLRKFKILLMELFYKMRGYQYSPDRFFHVKIRNSKYYQNNNQYAEEK